VAPEEERRRGGSETQLGGDSGVVCSDTRGREWDRRRWLRARLSGCGRRLLGRGYGRPVGVAFKVRARAWRALPQLGRQVETRLRQVGLGTGSGGL
jgi:hypothetical protein